jgi:hypothetical protein
MERYIGLDVSLKQTSICVVKVLLPPRSIRE